MEVPQINDQLTNHKHAHVAQDLRYDAHVNTLEEIGLYNQMKHAY